MPAFFVADVDWKDPAARSQYLSLFGNSIAPYGGKVFAGPATSMEGNWTPALIAIVQFDDAIKARQWYDSPEYAEAKKLRLANSDSRSILFESQS